MSKFEHNYNTEFDKLCHDVDAGIIGPKETKAFIRPAYFGTSLCKDSAENKWSGKKLTARSGDDKKRRNKRKDKKERG